MPCATRSLPSSSCFQLHLRNTNLCFELLSFVKYTLISQTPNIFESNIFPFPFSRIFRGQISFLSSFRHACTHAHHRTYEPQRRCERDRGTLREKREGGGRRDGGSACMFVCVRCADIPRFRAIATMTVRSSTLLQHTAMASLSFLASAQ